jgi:hypothetical protein
MRRRSTGCGFFRAGGQGTSGREIPQEGESRNAGKNPIGVQHRLALNHGRFFAICAIPTHKYKGFPLGNAGKSRISKRLAIFCVSARKMHPAQRFSVTVAGKHVSPSRLGVAHSASRAHSGPSVLGAHLTACPVDLRLAMGRTKLKQRLGCVRGLHSEGCNIEGSPQK